MRSATSSVYSAARARTGTSTSATSHTTEATLDTTQLYHGGHARRRRPPRARAAEARSCGPARAAGPAPEPFDDVTGAPPGGAFILADLPQADGNRFRPRAPPRPAHRRRSRARRGGPDPFGPDNARAPFNRGPAHRLGPAAEAGRTLRLGDQPAAEREMRKPGALERVDGVLGRAHERFAVEVERGVEHGADAGAALELTDHPIVAGVPRFVEDL